MRSAARTILLLLAAALALSGCGDSGDDDGGAFDSVFDQIEGLNGPERERKLRELARGEGGELTFYTSINENGYAAIGEEFRRRYGVKVSIFRADAESVAQRISQEAKANRSGADVVDAGGQEMASLSRLGLFVPYHPTSIETLGPSARQDGWTASRLQKFVIAWNTDLVRDGEQPRSFEDLADRRWRGKLALEAGDVDWYKTLRDHWIGAGKSEAEADRLLEGIAANARVTQGHSLLMELLAAGEFAVAPAAYLYHARDAASEGAPVAYEPIVEPVFSRPNGVGLLKTAEHPATAVLFVEWLLGDGQELLAKINSEPSRADLDMIDAKEVPVDLEALVDDQQEWKDRYDDLIRGSRKVGD